MMRLILCMLCLAVAGLLAPAPCGAQTTSTAGAEIDLAALKARFENAVVKIEFTAVSNKEDTKLNPTKSEIYYSGTQPPHGTGFFISDTEILTNAHVVEDARRGSIRVRSIATGNVEFKAEVVGVGGAESIDLALLRLPEDEALRFRKRSGLDRIPHMTLGDSDAVRQADPVAVFGYPQSSDELKLMPAKVTGRQYLRQKYDRFVCGHQFIEVGPGGVVQPGNSGGPALDRDGRVIGVPSRASGYAYEQGWLIPSSICTQFLGQIRTSEAGRRRLVQPRLGLRLTENFAGTAVWSGAPDDCVIYELGALVREVTSNSLAADWGIVPGDMIVGFANRQKGISCALDFGGYRVTTGKMRNWPAGTPDNGAAATAGEPAKLHLHELVLTSSIGDDITLWYVRRGQDGIQKMEHRLAHKEPVELPHLGTYDKPAYELWGDFVAQDFNDYNTALFEVPDSQVQSGGVLVTFVEPNSLASRRGMQLYRRSVWGFMYAGEQEPATAWVIVDKVNGRPVANLKQFKAALRDAEKRFEARKRMAGYDPARQILLRERYVEIGFRTNTYHGSVIRLNPAFPIDEALDCREAPAAADGRG